MEMESPTISAQEPHHHPQPPQTLSPCGSGRRSSSASNSPEFEFWMVRNPIFPQPDLPSADELFVDGVLLPLHHLHLPQPDPPDPAPEPETGPGGPEPPAPEADHLPDAPDPDPEPGPQLTPASSATASKRWRDIFKKSEKKSVNNQEEKPPPAPSSSSAEKDKEKKKEKKSHGLGGSGSGPTELNINLWPFSRSRSAGNGGARPRLAAFGGASARKVSSAPCSRSNSAGDSKSRKWPSSPGRVGVHLGRSSPVWQVRRGAPPPAKAPVPAASDPAARSVDKVVLKSEAAGEPRRSKAARSGSGGGANKARVLNLNVPMCIGYRHHLSCRSDDNSAIRVAGAECGDTNSGSGGGGDGGGGGGGGGGTGGSSTNIFNLRSLFTKKVH
ncbi:hypothetical protein BT93_D0623 [Corymbia citriodora subsp. variegata]|nr:hypothetical protein BT93_D0623 [Corymbia citriodora subsp. variegata]